MRKTRNARRAGRRIGVRIAPCAPGLKQGHQPVVLNRECLDFDRINRDHPGSHTKSQCERLLAALRSSPITTFDAMRRLDIYYVPARVLQLRKAGHRIITLWQTVSTEAGVNHRVGLYVLQRGGDHA